MDHDVDEENMRDLFLISLAIAADTIPVSLAKIEF